MTGWTAAELKSARRELGLTQAGLARLLRLSDDRTIRRWEQGEREISGPATVALEYLMQGVPDDLMREVVPEWLIGDDAEGRLDYEYVLHLWRPRFLGIVINDEVREALAGRIDMAEIGPNEWLAIPMWIDKNDGFNVEDLVGRAAAAVEAHMLDMIGIGDDDEKDDDDFYDDDET